MELLQHPLTRVTQTRKAGIISRFMTWCENQENNRIAWMAVAVGGHGCIITPITIFLIMMSGNNFIFWPLAMGSMAACLIVNLAALPTKITIPIFFASVAIDLLVIANCIAMGLHFV